MDLSTESDKCLDFSSISPPLSSPISATRRDVGLDARIVVICQQDQLKILDLGPDLKISYDPLQMIYLSFDGPLLDDDIVD